MMTHMRTKKYMYPVKSRAEVPAPENLSLLQTWTPEDTLVGCSVRRSQKLRQTADQLEFESVCSRNHPTASPHSKDCSRPHHFFAWADPAKGARPRGRCSNIVHTIKPY
jgi:hypothetical protein